MHDFNAGIADSGLFWTIQVPDEALTVSKNGKTATLHMDDVSVVDSFVFLGENSVPATVSFDVTWTGSGARHHFKPGSDDPTDPTNFNGKFRFGVGTGTFSGINLAGSVGVVIRENFTRSDGTYGIQLDATSDGNLVGRNSAFGNTFDLSNSGSGNCFKANRYQTSEGDIGC